MKRLVGGARLELPELLDLLQKCIFYVLSGAARFVCGVVEGHISKEYLFLPVIALRLRSSFHSSLRSGRSYESYARGLL